MLRLWRQVQKAMDFESSYMKKKHNLTSEQESHKCEKCNAI